MGTPSDGERPDERDETGDELYEDAEEGDYVGFDLSDERLAEKPEWVTDEEPMSVEEWKAREPNARDRVLMKLFGDGGELSSPLGGGLIQWFVTRLMMLMILMVLIGVLASAVGWGALFAGFDGFGSGPGSDGEGSSANASVSLAELASDVREARSGFGSGRRIVTVVGVSTGSSFTVRVPDSSTGAIHRVRLIAATAPPPSEGVREPTPSLYGLQNTSANRSCLNAWGDRGLNRTRSLIDGENVTLIAPMTDEGNGSTDGSAAANSSAGGAYYAVHDNSSLSARLLREGYGRLPDREIANRDNYSTIRDRARENGTGVWGCPTRPNETG